MSNNNKDKILEMKNTMTEVETPEAPAAGLLELKPSVHAQA